jgi:K+-sensing histidine kinase KdpD
MRALKGVLPIVVSVGVIMAVTALLWQLRLAANSSQHLIYIYLFPVTLIAALYNGRVAVLSTVIALRRFFLEDPL